MSTLTDPIADFLSRIRNGTRAGKAEVMIPYSKIKADMAGILKKEGYIIDFEVMTGGGHAQIKVVNKFVARTPAITGIKRISKPGLRRYVGAQEIPRVLGGMGVAVLSTPNGVLSGRDAKRQNVGGEVLAYVW